MTKDQSSGSFDHNPHSATGTLALHHMQSNFNLIKPWLP